MKQYLGRRLLAGTLFGVHLRREISRQSLAAMTALTMAYLVIPASALAQNAYITNNGSDTVSVINTASNAVTATIPVGAAPISFGIFMAASRCGLHFYCPQKIYPRQIM